MSSHRSDATAHRLVAKLDDLHWDDQQYFYLLPLWLRDELIATLSVPPESAIKNAAPQVASAASPITSRSGPADAAPSIPSADAVAWLKGAQVDEDGRLILTREYIVMCLQSVNAATADPISAEVHRAVAKFPTWPTDPLHALAVLGEEFGELTKAMLQLTYEPHKTSAEEVRTEALQTTAMALRLFRSLDRYEYKRGEQHEQAMTVPPATKET